MKGLGFIAFLASGASAHRASVGSAANQSEPDKASQPGLHKGLDDKYTNLDPKWQLTEQSVPAFRDWKHSDGLFPQMQTEKDLHMTMWEHTNLKASEYSFTMGDPAEYGGHRGGFNTEEKRLQTIGRFHTYYLGRSADFRIGVGKRQRQSKRLLRVTSHRHGNPIKNYKSQIYAIRDAQKHTRFTVVRKRVHGYRNTPLAAIVPPKLMTAIKHQLKNDDVFEFYKGWCPNGPRGQGWGSGAPSHNRGPKNQPCGEQVMTQVCSFKVWECNWYNGSYYPEHFDRNAGAAAVGTLKFISEKWSKTTFVLEPHRKQVWDLHAHGGGDVGLMMVGAMLNDILRAQEALNLARGHNIVRMDMGR